MAGPRLSLHGRRQDFGNVPKIQIRVDGLGAIQLRKSSRNAGVRSSIAAKLAVKKSSRPLANQVPSCRNMFLCSIAISCPHVNLVVGPRLLIVFGTDAAGNCVAPMICVHPHAKSIAMSPEVIRIPWDDLAPEVEDGIAEFVDVPEVGGYRLPGCLKCGLKVWPTPSVGYRLYVVPEGQIMQSPNWWCFLRT